MVNLLVLLLLANVMLGLAVGYWMSQALPFFAFLHTALVFVELSAWASTEPVRHAVTQPSPCPALTWLVTTCAPPTSVRTALASARRAPCLACQPALTPGLDGCGGRSWLSNHPGLAFLGDGWGGRPGAQPLAMLWSFQDILVGWYWSPAQVCALWQR